jgi:DNA-binding transcriptional LysR family regulator
VPAHFIHGQTYIAYFVALSAAIAGQGVALGWHHIVKDLLANQRLVRLGNENWCSDHPFTLTASKP